MSGRLTALYARADRVLLRLLPGRRLKYLYARLNERLFLGRGWDVEARVPLALGATFTVTKRDTVGRMLYYFGVWEPCISALVTRLLKPGDAFVDVGANLGYYAVLAARRVGPAGRVIAFEASPTIHERLRRHLAENGCGAVETHNLAVADRRGEIAIYLGPDSNRGNTSIFDDDQHAFEARVPAAPLAELLDDDALARARVIKIDVEGAEPLVLAGLAPAIDRLRRDVAILVEMNSAYLAQAGTTAEAVLAPWRAAGFRLFRIANEYSMHFYIYPLPEPQIVEIEEIPEGLVDLVLSREPLA